MPDPPAVPLLRWDGGSGLGVDVAVTTRHGGGSAAPYDTLNLGLHVGDDPDTVVPTGGGRRPAFGVALDDLVFARQVHGATPAVVGPADRGRGTRTDDDAIPDTDILVTTSPRVTLAILVADCVPLALVDPEAGVLAVVHAGWRGTAAGAVGRAVLAMQECGADARATPRLPRARRASRPLPGLRRGATGLDRRRAPRCLGPRGGRGPTVPATGWSTWWRPTANSSWPAGSGATASPTAAPPRPTGRFFSDRAQRPCGRFALLARLTR